MKHLTTLGICLGSLLAFSLLPAFRSPTPAPELPGGIRAGSVVFAFSVLQGGAGGLGNLDAKTPVTLREVQGDWVLIDYPAKVGGPSWVNVNSIVSYQITR